MIDSPSNAIVKSLKALAEAKARRVQRQFVVEGMRTVEEGLRTGHKPAVCLYNTDLLTRTERGAALLKNLLSLKGVPLYETSVRALEAAAETVHPQGVIAAFPFIGWSLPTETGSKPLALICDDIQDPGNMGTLLRTAEAAGLHAVWTTPRSVDVYNPKVVRAAMGAHFRLPIRSHCIWEVIMQDLETVGIYAGRLFCTDTDAQTAYDTVDWTLPSALVVSNEAHGLTPEARAACKQGVTIAIPMSARAESLNAAIAGAVVMFEAARQRRS